MAALTTLASSPQYYPRRRRRLPWLRCDLSPSEFGQSVPRSPVAWRGVGPRKSPRDTPPTVAPARRNQPWGGAALILIS
ncbi:hypothetical protein E2C01_073314 [Portunus trituberculatus]|uniref:Uncharacterized protein n=1 Tax=Portunus trituberculatus TaxID=210409 RepID=A0A5B7IA90_PORTR|nr:hypothetical protein [Portunus trituberculatus]